MSHKPSEKKIKDVKTLFFKTSPSVRFVNLITIYRIATFPLLILFALTEQFHVFKWLLLLSFFTDAIDGYLARRYNATSILGAKLDSIGDDLTILAAVIGLFMKNAQFIKEQLPILAALFGLFFIQLTFSLIRYKKMSSFHTYLAKTAAVVTAIFLLSVFFLDDILYPLFYAACIITGIELVEETIIVWLLPKWKTNVKGVYWVLKGEV